ncbi:MAG: O-antigen ligase family protein [Candidatus Limnocylindria bacterium]
MVETTIRSPADERPSGILQASIAVMMIALVPAAAVLEVPLPIIAGVGAILAFTGLALRPEAATVVVVAALYSNAAVVAVRFHHVPFLLAAGSVFLLAVPLGYYLLVRRMPLIMPRAVPWIMGYLGVQLASTLLARDSGSAAESLVTFLTEGLLLYLLLVNVVRSERMVLVIVWTLLLVGATLAVLSIHQDSTQNFSSNYLGFAQVGGDQSGALPGEPVESRTAGPLGRANRYAQILVIALPLVLGIVWGKYSRRASLAAIVAGVLMVIAVGLTLSRGAAVGFVLVIGVMVAFRYIRWRHLALVAIGVLVVFLAVPQYGARLQSLQSVPGVADAGVEADGSIRSRLTEMIAAALVFVDHPFLGVGPGQFPSYYIDYAQEFGLRVRAEDREAHNLYVGIASDTGLLGSIFFFGAIGVTLRDLAKTRRRLLATRPRLAHMAAAFMFAITAYLTTGFFLHLAFERYLWLMLAVGAAITVIGSAGPGGADDSLPGVSEQKPDRLSWIADHAAGQGPTDRSSDHG